MLQTVLGFVPICHAAMVIVNHTTVGGTGGLVGVTSTDPNWMFMAVHELGHVAFGLADEYEYYLGCGSGETGQDVHPSLEPDEPNVTTELALAFLKWGPLIDDGVTPMPTTENWTPASATRRPARCPKGRSGRSRERTTITPARTGRSSTARCATRTSRSAPCAAR